MQERMVLALLVVLVSGGAGRMQARPLPPEVQQATDKFKVQLYFASKDLRTEERLVHRADEKVQTVGS